MSLAPETQHPPPAKKIESHHPKRGKMKEANRRRSQKPTNTHLQILTSSDIMNRTMLPVVRRPLLQNDLARRQSVTVQPRLEVPSLRRLLAAEGLRAPLRSGDQGVSAACEALVQATGGSELGASPLDPEAGQTGEGARGRGEKGRGDAGPEEVSDVHGGRGWGLGLVLFGIEGGKQTQPDGRRTEGEREKEREDGIRVDGKGAGGGEGLGVWR